MKADTFLTITELYRFCLSISAVYNQPRVTADLHQEQSSTRIIYKLMHVGLNITQHCNYKLDSHGSLRNVHNTMSIITITLDY